MKVFENKEQILKALHKGIYVPTLQKIYSQYIQGSLLQNITTQIYITENKIDLYKFNKKFKHVSYNFYRDSNFQLVALFVAGEDNWVTKI